MQAFLNSIKDFIIVLDIVLLIIAALVIGIMIDYKFRRKVDAARINNERLRAQYQLLNRWFSLTLEGIDIRQVLIDKGYKSIAIYGMAELGERLFETFKDSPIEVKYAIDIAKYGSRKDIDIRKLDDPLDPVDVVIVTPFLVFDEVAYQLRKKKISADIISLEDFIESL